jgi:hypothetical protein
MSPWRRKRRRRRINFVPVLFCAALCLIAGFLHQTAQETEEYTPVAASRPFRENPLSVHGRVPLKRPIYPYSVIRGGVRDRGELLAELGRDPVVAAHYAGFGSADAHVVPLQSEMLAHVSYRVADKVFWTAKTVRLAPGEELITDGRSYARTRCGNRVSVLAQEPTSPEEPAAEYLETPIEEEAPRLEIVEQPPLPPERPFSPPSWNPPVTPPPEWPYFPPPIYPPPVYPPPPAVIPEPATLILLASGLAAQLLIWFARRK